MTPYEERLADDLQSSLREALRVLERDVSRAGKPCPNLAQLAAIRVQASQATAQANELFGVMSMRPNTVIHPSWATLPATKPSFP